MHHLSQTIILCFKKRQACENVHFFYNEGGNSPGGKKIPYARNASQLQQFKNEYVKDHFFKKYMIFLINHNGSLEPIMVYYKK